MAKLSGCFKRPVAAKVCGLIVIGTHKYSHTFGLNHIPISGERGGHGKFYLQGVIPAPGDVALPKFLATASVRERT